MKRLTCVRNGRVYVTHAPRQRCPESRAPQSRSLAAARTRASSRGGRAACPGLLYVQAPGLSLSRASAAAETPGPGGRRQGILHGQAFAHFGGEPPDLRRLDWINVERNRQQGRVGAAASRGRTWLSAGQFANARYGWSISLIDCWRRSWLRLMPCWCPIKPGHWPARQEAGGRF
jgi:hypothetical protein